MTAVARSHYDDCLAVGKCNILQNMTTATSRTNITAAPNPPSTMYMYTAHFLLQIFCSVPFPFVPEKNMNEWMSNYFTSFLKSYQSYQDNWNIRNPCAQQGPFMVEIDCRLQEVSNPGPKDYGHFKVPIYLNNCKLENICTNFIFAHFYTCKVK